MNKTKAKKILIPIAVILVLLFLSIVLGYGTSFKDPISSSLKKVFPAAIIGSDFISVYDHEQALTAYKKLDIKQTSALVMEKLIRDAKMRNLASKTKTKVTHPTVEEELIFYKKTNASDYNTFLQKYFFGSEEYFKRLIVEPNANDVKLRISFYSAQSGSFAFTHAKQLLARFKAGEKFEDLAKIESQDLQSAQFGGDLGFFEKGDLLPELEAALASAQLGQVFDNIVVSRHGYHIIYPIEVAEKEGQKLWHAKHILIKGEGFEPWLNSELSKIGSWAIIK